MNWREKIELNQVVSKMSEKFDLERHEEPCPKEAKENLAKEVEKSIWLNRFAPKIRATKSIAALNRVLEDVFNEADRRRIWCGFPY